MLNYIFAFLLLLSFAYPVFSQDTGLYHPELKLKNNPLPLDRRQANSFSQNLSLTKGTGYYDRSGLSTGTTVAGIIFLLVNPILVFEDKKIFWGLTKEISKSFYPYGRLAFEYSFLFRTFNKNHLRFSYNYDLIYRQGRGWMMFVISMGAGYFTDTENKGAFAQTSMGFFIPTPVFLIHPYLKYRFTKISKENKSDIHDISLGAGFVF